VVSIITVVGVAVIGWSIANRMFERTESLPPEASGAARDAKEALSREELELLVTLGYVDKSPMDADSIQDGATIHNRDALHLGFTMVTLREPCMAQLIDIDGVVWRSWRSYDCAWWNRAELFPNGDVLIVEGKGFLSRFSWQGKLLWRKKIGAHHDLERLPDGRIAPTTRAARNPVARCRSSLSCPGCVGQESRTRNHS
jgi:hypothetical protein